MPGNFNLNFSQPSGPGLSLQTLPALPAAVPQALVEANDQWCDPAYVRAIFLKLAPYLLDAETRSALLPADEHDPHRASLKTLFARLQAGHLAPSPLPEHTSDAAKVKATMHLRTGMRPMVRPLEDFEDLYYALLAKMQAQHHVLRARVESNFNGVGDALYVRGPTIAGYVQTLVEFWMVVNEPDFVQQLDEAVRRARIRAMHQDMLAQVQLGALTEADMAELLADLYDEDEYAGMHGMAWIGGWAPSMIAAWLDKKYRVVLGVEKDAAAKKVKDERRKMRARHAAAKEKKEKEESQKVLRAKVRAAEHDRLMRDIEKRLQEEHFARERHVQEQARLEQEQARREREQASKEWEMKTQRVSQYQAYLRNRAGDGAVWVVQNCKRHKITGSYYQSGYEF